MRRASLVPRSHNAGVADDYQTIKQIHALPKSGGSSTSVKGAQTAEKYVYGLEHLPDGTKFNADEKGYTSEFGKVYKSVLKFMEICGIGQMKAYLLIVYIVIGLVSPLSGQALECDDSSGFKQLMAGPPQSRYKYRGRYVNLASGYSVRIPNGMTGYDGRGQSRHNGFALGVGKTTQGVIFVAGDPNSIEYKTPREAAMGEVEIVRESGSLIESQTISDSRLGALDAARVVVTYRCKGSGERWVQSSVVALSPEKEFVYSLQMYVRADRYPSYQKVMDQLIRSWRFIPV